MKLKMILKDYLDDIDITNNRLGNNSVAERNKRLADILIGISKIEFADIKENI